MANKTDGSLNNKRVSYWNVFRLVFVPFSVYLLGHALFFWDGFSYSGTFMEFLPSVSLIAILWTGVAVVSAMFLWMLCRVLDWLDKRSVREVRLMPPLLIAVFSFLVLAVILWYVMTFIWQFMSILHFLPFVFIVSLVVTWFFRKKAEQWVEVVLERLTPLVWLFGIFFMVALPIVTYHAFLKGTDLGVSQELIESASEGEDKPNIILVTFDAISARNMSVYGYHRDTTPFIKEWAKTASLFSRTNAGGNYTTPTTATLMTGKRVWTHQTYTVTGSANPVRSDIENLPLVLKKNGYYNIAYVANRKASVNRLGIAGSFDIALPVSKFYRPQNLFGLIDKILYRFFAEKIWVHDWILRTDFIFSVIVDLLSGDYKETVYPPERVFNSFLEFVDGNPPQPFFAWIHIMPPHDPYLVSERYRGTFSTSSELRSAKVQDDIKKKSYRYLYKSQPVPEEMNPSVEISRDYYDEFMKESDRHFEEFINKLTEDSRLKNSIIIFSGDHGESFEHGYFTHGGPFLYEQVTHVPLIIKEPGQVEGRVIPDLVDQVDIPATILDLADIQVPSWMEGRTLKPLLRGQEMPEMYSLSMTFEMNRGLGQPITKGSIAIWEGNYKLIFYIEKQEALLFNLKKDPDELNNIRDQEPGTAFRLVSIIQKNLKEANERIIGGRSPEH